MKDNQNAIPQLHDSRWQAGRPSDRFGLFYRNNIAWQVIYQRSYISVRRYTQLDLVNLHVIRRFRIKYPWRKSPLEKLRQ